MRENGKTSPSQAEYWNGINGEIWAREAELTDPRLESFGEVVMAALAPSAGERVLDVGCGAGATSRALARRVGADGLVIGADISRPLLDVARARGGGPRYVEADAGAAAFDVVFDKVFSRFGVMFFEEPRAAFANLRRVAPHGRLGFVCWRSPDENPAMTQPLALVQHLFPDGPAFDPDAPGPFSFADRDKVARILSDAGWRELTIERHDSDYLLGATVNDAIRYVTTIGPLSRVLREHPTRREEALVVLHDFFERQPSGPITLPATTWLVTAAA